MTGGENGPQHVVATADLGTNTIKITIASMGQEGAITELLEGAETIRLGAGIEETGQIEPERLEQCVAVLRDYEQRARALGATAFVGVATEALRIAINSMELLNRIQRETAWSIRVISGEEEARLTFVGLQDRLPDEGTALIVDVGGGSTELVRSVNGAMAGRQSIPLGSGRLADRFFRSDPPSLESLHQAVSSATEAASSIPMLDDVEDVLLSGGNGVFLADLCAQLYPDEPLSVKTLDQLLVHFSTAPAANTADRLSIAHERARVLPAGAAIALSLLTIIRPRHAWGVPSGIRIGLLREFAAAQGHGRTPGQS